jgi:LPXTG-motif cell wall-anchored protein
LSGPSLPVTGSIFTLPFLLVGLAMMLAGFAARRLSRDTRDASTTAGRTAGSNPGPNGDPR